MSTSYKDAPTFQIDLLSKRMPVNVIIKRLDTFEDTDTELILNNYVTNKPN